MKRAINKNIIIQTILYKQTGHVRIVSLFIERWSYED